MSLQTQLYQFSHRFDIPVLIGRWRSTLAAAEPHASPSLLGLLSSSDGFWICVWDLGVLGLGV